MHKVSGLDGKNLQAEVCIVVENIQSPHLTDHFLSALIASNSLAKSESLNFPGLDARYS